MSLLETLSGPFRKARSVNASDSSFPSKIPVATEPSGDAGTATGASVIDLAINPGGGGVIQNGVLIVPYGLGNDNDAFSIRVIGWKRISTGDPTTVLWVPIVLAELACIISTTVGIAGKLVIETERFADTITRVTGSDRSCDIVSPTAEEIAHAYVDLKGFEKLELTYDQTTGTPTMNALLSFY